MDDKSEDPPPEASPDGSQEGSGAAPATPLATAPVVDTSVRSGVGVLDRAMAVFDAVLGAREPLGLADLVAATGLPRATAHRLAVALTDHGMLRRSADGRFGLGLRLIGVGHAVAAGWPLAELARPALARLRDHTGESAQLYVRDGDQRVCLVSLESSHELRTIVPEGARLPLGRGSAGRILDGGGHPSTGWIESRGERAPGVGSVSAPVLDRAGVVVAAVGVSGPLDRLGAGAGARVGPAVVEAARRVEAALAG